MEKFAKFARIAEIEFSDIVLSTVQTFPFHFHDEKYDKVKQTPFFIENDSSLEEIFRKFLEFVRKIFANKNST